MSTDIFSRSVLAGYEPDVLRDAKVPIIGLGALGQNLAQTLALSGIGNLSLIDFDVFEPHNATRSPSYPSTAVEAALGLSKAPVVAYYTQQAATMPGANVRYGNATIQQLGNGLIAGADVVVSAVDSIGARAWIAEQCRIHGKPMVEAGFSGPEFTLATFSGSSGEPCYRCANPERASSASCTLYALKAERSGIIPAIQTTAAAVGGLQAEVVIELLHGHAVEFGVRLYGNTRTHQFNRATLQTNPACPGEHGALPGLVSLLEVPETVTGLAAQLEGIGATQFALAEPLVTNPACRTCHATCDLTTLESTWLMQPECVNCGGTAHPADRTRATVYSRVLPTQSLGEIGDIELSVIGLTAGCSVTVLTEAGDAGLVYLGDVKEAFARLTPAAVDVVGVTGADQ